MNYILIILKGLIVGSSMLVPGFSGSSMAIVLGIYDKLISSVSNFFKNKRKNLIFLGTFSIGALLGIILFSKPILVLMKNYPLPMHYLFIGVALGGIKIIIKQSKISKININSIFFISIGIALIFLFSKSATNFRDLSINSSILNFLLLIIAGIISAVALVLPGISISYLLLLIGLYDETIKAISEVYFPFLIPLGTGFLIGIFFTSKILDKLLTKYPEKVYLVILGFILASIVEIFPGIPNINNFIISILLLTLGFLITHTISKE